MRVIRERPPIPCEECGAMFPPIDSRNVLCSTPCRRAVRLRQIAEYRQRERAKAKARPPRQVIACESCAHWTGAKGCDLEAFTRCLPYTAKTHHQPRKVSA